MKLNLSFNREDVAHIEWRWSDGGSFAPRPRELENILNISFVKDLVIHGPIKIYCFLLTSNEKLEIENCSENYPYICDGFKGEVLI